MNILVIIPAKLDSKRLFKKNILPVEKGVLLDYSVEYALNSKYNVSIIVSSESTEVRDIIKTHYGDRVKFHHRDLSLCSDTEVVDVYLDIINSIEETYDLVVGLQPDNPNRSNTMDECIEYMINNNYDDLVTVNPQYKRSGAVRIFKYEYLKTGRVSKRVGCIYDASFDIHYEADLINFKKTI
jgi:CMP-N-acetylneuraminic acid synthetase